MSREIIIYTAGNQELLRLLSASQARFLIIGGTAVWFHVPDRQEPSDLDLLIEPSEETAQKVIDALERVEGRTLGITASELARPSKGIELRGAFTVANVDVVTPYSGFVFSEHFSLAVEATMAFSSTPVRVASIPTMLEWLRYALTVEKSKERREKIPRDIALLEAAHQIDGEC